MALQHRDDLRRRHAGIGLARDEPVDERRHERVRVRGRDLARVGVAPVRDGVQRRAEREVRREAVELHAEKLRGLRHAELRARTRKEIAQLRPQWAPRCPSAPQAPWRRCRPSPARHRHSSGPPCRPWLRDRCGGRLVGRRGRRGLSARVGRRGGWPPTCRCRAERHCLQPRRLAKGHLQAAAAAAAPSEGPPAAARRRACARPCAVRGCGERPTRAPEPRAGRATATTGRRIRIEGAVFDHG